MRVGRRRRCVLGFTGLDNSERVTDGDRLVHVAILVGGVVDRFRRLVAFASAWSRSSVALVRYWRGWWYEWRVVRECRVCRWPLPLVLIFALVALCARGARARRYPLGELATMVRRPVADRRVPRVLLMWSPTAIMMLPRVLLERGC